jgi:hypothetical protein
VWSVMAAVPAPRNPNIALVRIPAHGALVVLDYYKYGARLCHHHGNHIIINYHDFWHRLTSFDFRKDLKKRRPHKH